MKYFSKLCNRLTGSSSQGDRIYQEDRLCVAFNEVQAEDEKNSEDYEYLFIGVFDGHGGREAAVYAKENLERNITQQRGFWSRKEKDVLRAIREGFILTHNEMWKVQESWPKTAAGFSSTSGTTASVAFIKNGKIFVGHVGDSKIVLGEVKNDNSWNAISLTEDHKPESPEEKSRITLAGGKVISKAGVPRVVWHRPKTSQPQGRQLRSTKTDEIPFLAIARSLGDLWSYNSQTGQFVVSPDPDLMVYEIDAVKHKCLIFGTDGLWNVVSPQLAVNLVYNATVLDNLNPSNVLCDEALNRWSSNDKRADNVSVITLMLGVNDNDKVMIPENENVAFIEEDETTMYESSSHDFCGFDYQDISHMAVDSECDALKAHKSNPNNGIFPKCVMRHINSTTFERYDYMNNP